MLHPNRSAGAAVPCLSHAVLLAVALALACGVTAQAAALGQPGETPWYVSRMHGSFYTDMPIVCWGTIRGT